MEIIESAGRAPSLKLTRYYLGCPIQISQKDERSTCTDFLGGLKLGVAEG
jgi:hypothetical protein